MNSKIRIYAIEKEILQAFNIAVPSDNIDVDAMVEDMCTATDADQIRMVGIFLYKCVCGEEKCYDPFNLAWFARSLSPFEEDINMSEYFRQNRIRFLQKITRQQLRLMLFVFMMANNDNIEEPESKIFITFGTNRYIELSNPI